MAFELDNLLYIDPNPFIFIKFLLYTFVVKLL